MTRWIATFVCCGAIGGLSQTAGPSVFSMILAAIALVAFIVVCATFGAFSRDAWIADEETARHLAAIDADIDAREGSR